MLKDMKLSQQPHPAQGSRRRSARWSTQVYGMHNAWGQGGADFSGVINLLRGEQK